jgi:hypothetical protein
MSSKKLESALEEYASENSDLRLINFLRSELVERMEKFSTEESDANEHKLNMVIRDLEEDLDRIENQKLSDWDPESN